MRLSVRRILVLLGLALCAGSVPVAAGSGGKSDRFVYEARNRGAASFEIIVRTAPGRRSAVRKVVERRGGSVMAEHPALDALTVRVSARELARLESDPAVLAISADAEVTSLGARLPHNPGQGQPVEALRETLGLSGLPFTGAGVNVAVIDSGIDPTKDLAGRIAGFWDFTQGGVATRPFDDYGHGTHVAGLIASTGLRSAKEFGGVAPGVTLYGLKVLDDRGRGRASDVIRALEFLTASRSSGSPSAIKVDIINLSLGHPIYEPAASDPLVRAVERAVRAGIVVITAAGNVGTAEDGTTAYTGITSPGNAPSAVTVGAADTKGTADVRDDLVASFSSRGPTWFDAIAKPDLVAPGVGLISDIPRASSLFDTYTQLKRTPRGGKGNLGRLSGTSMAAAVTTGAAALVLEANRAANPAGRSLSVNAVKAVLQFTAIVLAPGGIAYDTLTQGAGELNVRGALAMASAINTAMPAGTPWLRFRPEPQTVVAGIASPWSQAVIWDDALVSRTDALLFNSPQWADDVVWGAGFDDNIVWGTAASIDNIVWGTSVLWAADLVWPDRVIGLMADDNIVWGTVVGLTEDNIVWGTVADDNIVWGTWRGDNLVWGTSSKDNLVWGTAAGVDNLVWGTSRVGGDALVWGTMRVTGDSLVWGTAAGTR